MIRHTLTSVVAGTSRYPAVQVRLDGERTGGFIRLTLRKPEDESSYSQISVVIEASHLGNPPRLSDQLDILLLELFPPPGRLP